MTVCTPECWTPIKCPNCGNSVPPRGRSVPGEMGLRHCCDKTRYSPHNKRHLWSEHDSTRIYTDPEGWKEHVSGCELCKEDNFEKSGWNRPTDA